MTPPPDAASLRALDKELATALGASTEHPGAVYVQWTNEAGTDGGEGFQCPRCGMSEQSYDKQPCLKHFSTDHAAAFRLVDALFKHGWRCDIANYTGDAGEPVQWNVEFWQHGKNASVLDVDYQQRKSYGPSLPLAIATAALSVLRSEPVAGSPVQGAGE